MYTNVINGLIVVQDGNLYRVNLPNWTFVADVVVPLDNRYDIDFDLMVNITELLTKQAGLSEVNLKELKKLKTPSGVIISRAEENYRIYIGKTIQTGMLVGYLNLPMDLVTGKIVVAIAILIQKRWSEFKKQQTAVNQLHHTHLRAA